GNGYDVHRFGEGDHVRLGGVSIPHERGLIAHSDGDVLIHALCDALLGALALGDIGQHFPDSSDKYSGVDSRQLLRRVMQLIAEKGFALVNADCTLVAQKPKLSPYVDAMRETLASDLNTTADCVSVKATTTEGLGFAGREEGIACYAVVLLSASSTR
ncbi:2-C-methyl-D-erythritol 2,4-cyclodiphosphate synthase, partial [bacterium]|nr:2-C-methyl-D-erythritol 2,4-cyclodiphosphate synthase [bacterium]